MDARILLFIALASSITQLNASCAAESQTAPRATSTHQQSLRDWTNASGRRSARATLLEVQGEKVLLRTEDGKLAATAIIDLSEADRQFVASQRRTLSPVSE